MRCIQRLAVVGRTSGYRMAGTLLLATDLRHAVCALIDTFHCKPVERSEFEL